MRASASESDTHDNSDTKLDIDKKTLLLLSLSSIVVKNTRALQQRAKTSQRGWAGDVDAIVF